MVKSVGMLKGLLDGALLVLIAWAIFSIVLELPFISGDELAMVEVPITFMPAEGGISVQNEILGAGTIDTVDAVATFSPPFASWPNLLSIVVGVLSFAPILVIVILLRRIAASALEGSPFTEVNIGRIRAMGWLTIAFEILRSSAQIGVGVIVANTSAIAGHRVSLSGEVEFDVILIGVSLLVLAEIFRHGWSLQSDADLTV